MKDLSYGVFTVFIAFVLFTVIKNVFFNANQLSRKIRFRFLYVSLMYFVIYVMGISALILVGDKRNQLICIDVSFFGMTLSIIYTSLRMESNDTSAFNKRYYAIRISGDEPPKPSIETPKMIVLYIIDLVISLTPVALISETDDLGLLENNCFIAFLSLSLFLTTVIVLMNATFFGRLIRDNLLYNFLWDVAHGGNYRSEKQLKIAKNKMIELYAKLFTGCPYYKPNKRNQLDEKSVIKWIKSLTLKGAH